MPLSVIWLVTSFAIRLLVIYFRLVLLLMSRARALAGIGRRPAERGRYVVLVDEDLRSNERPRGKSRLGVGNDNEQCDALAANGYQGFSMT